MVFTNITNPRSHIPRRHLYETTYVQQGATIGANATIICGCTIGRYAFVGAGAVVTRDVQPHALVLGNPARQVGWMCQCGYRLNLSADSHDETTTCEHCHQSYTKQGNTVLTTAISQQPQNEKAEELEYD